MSGGRVNAFAGLDDPPVFATKPKPEKPAEAEKASIARLAEENNFPSRQAPKPVKEPRRKIRTHRTGRNTQFNAKVTAETMQRLYKAADDRHVVLGELLKLGVDALDALEALQKLAQRRGVSLDEIAKQAVNALERAGA
jgi:hypothetical protein